jgi:hypothetical protein
MTRSVQEIAQEVRLLHRGERNQLLRNLIADMDGEPEHDIDQAWLQEAKRRYEELQNSVVEPVPAAEVIQKAKSRLKNEG